MTLTKHYIFISKKMIIRKLFLCRNCNRKCVPSSFRIFTQDIKIATAYICTYCSKSHVTNKALYYSDTINVIIKNELKIIKD